MASETQNVIAAILRSPWYRNQTALPAWRANTATWSQFLITTPYDLRHLHATTLLERGAPLPFVSKRLGHRNSAITADVYNHLRASEDGTLGEMFGDAVEE